MSTSMTAILNTQFNGTGFRQASTELTDLDKKMMSTNKTATSFSTNYEGLGRKMERPLGRVAFGTLASELVGATGAMEGASKATVAVEGGIHAVGNALLFLNPEIGIVVIGVAALVAIFSKLSTASAQTADSISKQVNDLVTLSDEYKRSIEVLGKAGDLDTKQISILKDLKKSTDDQIETVKKKLDAA